jgi:hypothetical protein
MRWAWVLTLAVALGAATVPAASAQADASSTDRPDVGDVTLPPEDWRRATTAGAVHDEASPATLEIDGDQATLAIDPVGLRGPNTPEAWNAQSDTFSVEWTKTNVDRYGGAFQVDISGNSDVFGTVDLSGVWQANSVFAICTQDIPTSYCVHYATGPITLTGTVGDDAAEFSGNARDTYCTTGHEPANQKTVCGEDTLVPAGCSDCLVVQDPIHELVSPN